MRWFWGRAGQQLGARCRRTYMNCASVLRESATLEKLKCCTLPSGLCIRHTSSIAEVEFLYSEHFEQQIYLQHQVSLSAGGVVLDVGANIGLFAMAAAEAVGATGLVICIEPEPGAAAALRHNMKAHAEWHAVQGKQVAPCIVVEAAAADGSTAWAELTVYQGASGWSTVVRDDKELMSNMQAYIAHLLEGSGTQWSSSSTQHGRMITGSQVEADAAGSLSGWTLLQRSLSACCRWLVRVEPLAPLAQALAVMYVQQVMMGDVDAVTVDTCTVSDIIQQHNIKRVALLKVDVERAELDVLRGVQQQHWSTIQQVAMEVHDTNGHLHRTLDVLQRQAGFQSVVHVQVPQLRGSTLYNVYAVGKQP